MFYGGHINHITKICGNKDRKKTNKMINRMIDISKKRTASIANKKDTTVKNDKVDDKDKESSDDNTDENEEAETEF